jgi:hypothetical protein
MNKKKTLFFFIIIHQEYHIHHHHGIININSKNKIPNLKTHKPQIANPKSENTLKPKSKK